MASDLPFVHFRDAALSILLINRTKEKAPGSRPRAIWERFGTRRVRAESAVSIIEWYQVRVSPLKDKEIDRPRE